MPAPEFCDRCTDPPNAELLQGIDLFNRQEYFACHEVLEDAWNVERGEVRILYKGILQVGVGCYHLLRHNYRGATAKLRSGADYLTPFAPVCMHVDVTRLIADALTLLHAVEAVGPSHTADVDRAMLPIIRQVKVDDRT